MSDIILQDSDGNDITLNSTDTPPLGITDLDGADITVSEPTGADISVSETQDDNITLSTSQADISLTDTDSGDITVSTEGQGPQGIQGEPGEGVPTGGTTGQVLAKNSTTDYDTEWIDVVTDQTYDEYIYNSSGAQVDNRYNDWSDLMSAVTGGQEGPKKITFEQNESLPAGTWDLDYVTFAGDGKISLLGGLVVTMPTGFVLGGSGYWINGHLADGIGISYTANVSLITAPAGVSTFSMDFGNAIQTTTASFFNIPSGAVYIITLEQGSALANGGYEPVTVATGATSYLIIGSSNASIGNNIFRGTIDPGAGLLLIDSSAANVDPARTDANLTGTYTFYRNPKALNVGFDNSGTGLAADNVQDALEELDGDKVAKAGDSMTGALNITATDNNLNINRSVDTDRSIMNFTTASGSAWRVGKYGNGGSDENFYIHKSGGGDPIAIDHTTEAITINGDYTLPTSDGTANYVLTTDGSGSVTWQPGSGGSGTTGFAWQDYEKTGTYVYVGYENASTSHWYIYRRTIATNAREYATGTSAYSTNWTGRAGLTYA